MVRVFALVALVWPGLAAAEIPLTPDGFDALVTGKTFEYANGTDPFGAETYFRGRRVLWRYRDGTCHYGIWYPAGDQICFAYEDISGNQCWTFFLDGTRLTARFASDPEDRTVYETRQSHAPLQCPGPKVGA